MSENLSQSQGDEDQEPNPEILSKEIISNQEEQKSERGETHEKCQETQKNINPELSKKLNENKVTQEEEQNHEELENRQKKGGNENHENKENPESHAESEENKDTLAKELRTVTPEEINSSLEQMYKEIIFASTKNQKEDINQFDIQKLSYEYLKEISKIRISKDESFMIRMVFDVLKRQSQDKKIKALIDKNKVRMDEDERIKGFNRLIEDANRRLEAQEQLEILKKKLDEEVMEKPSKKYKDDQWKEIYNQRFLRYQEDKDKKLNRLIKEKKEKERQKEEEEVKLCKVKKAPSSITEQYGKRLYEESLKRKGKPKKIIKKKEQKTNKIDIKKDDFRQNLEKILKEDDDDNRSIPKPIMNDNDKVYEPSVKSKNYGDKKRNSAIKKFNPNDFIPRINSDIYVEETKADKIVKDFFLRKLHNNE